MPKKQRHTHKKTRSLTQAEIKLAQSVFGTSINYDTVRIAARCLPFQPKHGGMCTGNTINISGTAYLDDYTDTSTYNLKAFFIHEMTHIWQYQKSPAYLAKKYTAEILKHPFNYMAKAYRYSLNTHDSFDNYGIEQQAGIIQDYFAMTQNNNVGISRQCTDANLSSDEKRAKIETLIRDQFVTYTALPRSQTPKAISKKKL